MIEKLLLKFVWCLPRRLVYWSTIRLFTSASQKLGNRHVDSISVNTALELWNA